MILIFNETQVNLDWLQQLFTSTSVFKWSTQGKENPAPHEWIRWPPNGPTALLPGSPQGSVWQHHAVVLLCWLNGGRTGMGQWTLLSALTWPWGCPVRSLSRWALSRLRSRKTSKNGGDKWKCHRKQLEGASNGKSHYLRQMTFRTVIVAQWVKVKN